MACVTFTWTENNMVLNTLILYTAVKVHWNHGHILSSLGFKLDFFPKLIRFDEIQCYQNLSLFRKRDSEKFIGATQVRWKWKQFRTIGVIHTWLFTCPVVSPSQRNEDITAQVTPFTDSLMNTFRELKQNLHVDNCGYNRDIWVFSIIILETFFLFIHSSWINK